MPETILERIVAAVEQRLEATPEMRGLVGAAQAATATRRASGMLSLREALAAPGASVIAECKRASPSAGLIREDFDPVALARAYADGGAAAISVVTEPDFFGGDSQWPALVRRAVKVPVLRKDFIVSRRQLYESSVLGADAVLLIARLLDSEALVDLLGLAAELELEVLLEIFADEDPTKAIDSGAPILGVNARDLATFEVRTDRVRELGRELPTDRILVAESGIRGAGDVAALSAAGYDAFLIGEHLVRASDPARELRELRGC